MAESTTERYIAQFERAKARAETMGFKEYIPPFEKILEGLREIKQLDDKYVPQDIAEE